MTKKAILSSIFAIAFLVTAGYGVNLSMNNKANYSYLVLDNVEALAQSEQGCITRPGQNDGHCTTNGTVYFCENAAWFDKKDCVK
ncbi:Hypothetical protein PEIBARAKI_5865 [Petrimonas sp. IBARAKI]|nr:Hypothetical protein PEIBARAKI_5865 [Petrimonas sp. IBARAKI]